MWLVTKRQCRDSGLDIHDIYFVLYESSFIVPQFWKEETPCPCSRFRPSPASLGCAWTESLISLQPRFSSKLSSTWASERDVHLDLALLTFLDSAGLHAIVALARSLDGNRSVVLVNPSTAVMRCLEITGIDKHRAVEIRQRDMEPVAA